MGFSYGDTIRYGDGYALGVYEDGFALYKNGWYVIDGTKIKNEGLMTIHFGKLPGSTLSGKEMYRLISNTLEMGSGWVYSRSQ